MQRFKEPLSRISFITFQSGKKEKIRLPIPYLFEHKLPALVKSRVLIVSPGFHTSVKLDIGNYDSVMQKA
jgi:hypothetical protein